MLAASFFLPFCLLLAIFALLGIAPFGERSLLISDAFGQYQSFYALYQDLFAGKADWFYSFGKLLGGSVSGLFAYYLASPFQLILLLFPREETALAFDWMILLKLSACGLTMALYLRERRSLTGASLLFSTAYALCGYHNAYAWCTMWTDAAIMLPLVALGIERLWRQDRPLTYVLCLALAIISCFYTGYMLCLFSVLYYLHVVFRDTPSLRELRWKKLLRYALASLLAGGISAVLLLPGFLALRGGVPVSPYLALTRFTYPAALRILHFLAPGRANPDGLVMPVLLLCAFLFALLIALPWHFFRKKRDRAGFVMLAVSLGCFAAWYAFVDLPVCRGLGLSERHIFLKLLLGTVPFWEFYNGSPNLYAGSLPLLLALSFFLNRAVPRRERGAGLLLLLALLASVCFYLPNLVWHGFEENNCFNYRWSFVFPFVLLMLASRSFENREGLGDSALLLPFGACGLILLFALLRPIWFQKLWMPGCSAAFLCAELALLLCWRRGSVLALRMLCLTGIAALSLTACFSFRDQKEHSIARSALRAEVTAEQARIDFALAQADGFTRIRKDGVRINYNDPMLFRYPGLVHFSSAEKLSSIAFLSRVGLKISPEYWANGDLGESRTADALLGVGLVLGRNGCADYESVGEGVWKNPYALPLAYLADPGAAGEIALDEKVCRNLNGIFACLTGSEAELFRPAAAEGLRLTVESDDPLYLQSWSPLLTGCTVLCDGEVTAELQGLYAPGAFCLGSFRPGQTVEVLPTGEDGLPAPDEAVLFYESSDALRACSEELNKGDCEIELLSASRIRVRTACETERLLVITLPREEGWSVTADGVKTEACTALNVLMAMPLAAGEHEIVLRFTPPGLTPGAALTAGSLLSLLGWELLRRRKEKKTGSAV